MKFTLLALSAAYVAGSVAEAIPAPRPHENAARYYFPRVVKRQIFVNTTDPDTGSQTTTSSSGGLLDGVGDAVGGILNPATSRTSDPEAQPAATTTTTGIGIIGLPDDSTTPPNPTPTTTPIDDDKNSPSSPQVGLDTTTSRPGIGLDTSTDANPTNGQQTSASGTGQEPVGTPTTTGGLLPTDLLPTFTTPLLPTFTTPLLPTFTTPLTPIDPTSDLPPLTPTSVTLPPATNFPTTVPNPATDPTVNPTGGVTNDPTGKDPEPTTTPGTPPTSQPTTPGTLPPTDQPTTPPTQPPTDQPTNPTVDPTGRPTDPPPPPPPANETEPTVSPTLPPTTPAFVPSEPPSSPPTVAPSRTEPPQSIVPTGTDNATALIPDSTIQTAPPPATTPPTDTKAAPSSTQTTMPSDVPRVITPEGGVPVPPEDSTLIQIAFKEGLHYEFVVGSQLAINQIFTYLPLGVSEGLNMTESKMVMQYLQPYNTLAKLHYVTTLAMAYIPANEVDKLSMQIINTNSELYENPDKSVKTLMDMIDPTVPLLAGQGLTPGGTPVNAGDGTANTGSNDGEDSSPGSDGGSSGVRPSSVGIAVGAVAGAAVYGAAMFLVARRYKKRKAAHQRASSVQSDETPRPGEGTNLMTGARNSYGSRMPGRMNSNNGRGSRNSDRSDESGRSGRTYISPPVMAENSLGWN